MRGQKKSRLVRARHQDEVYVAEIQWKGRKDIGPGKARDKNCSGFAEQRLFLSHHHGHLSAFHFRQLLNLADFLKIVAHPHQNFHTEILMHHLSATEPQGNLDLVTVVEKTPDITQFNVVICPADTGAEFHFLDVEGFLLFARNRSFFLRFVFEFTIIHQLADGWLCTGRYFDQVITGFGGHFEGPIYGDDADLLTLTIDKTDAVYSYIFVDARSSALWRD